MIPAAESVSYAEPRGEVRMHHRHLEQLVHLAQADHLQFDVVARL